MRGKYQKLKAHAIQKEQYKLTKVESMLNKLLTRVNESINELKVEELHLKSSLIEHYTENSNDDQPSTSAQAALRFNAIALQSDNKDDIDIQESKFDMDGIENINKQMLALESLLVPLKQNTYNNFEEEEDEDYYDDDDYDSTENDSECE